MIFIPDLTDDSALRLATKEVAKGLLSAAIDDVWEDRGDLFFLSLTDNLDEEWAGNGELFARVMRSLEENLIDFDRILDEVIDGW